MVLTPLRRKYWYPDHVPVPASYPSMYCVNWRLCVLLLTGGLVPKRKRDPNLTGYDD